MKRYLIDADLLLSFVTDRNPDQQARAARLLEQAAHGKALLLCPHNVLVAAVARREKRATAATFDRTFAQALRTLKLAVWEG